MADQHDPQHDAPDELAQRDQGLLNSLTPEGVRRQPGEFRTADDLAKTIEDAFVRALTSVLESVRSRPDRETVPPPPGPPETALDAVAAPPPPPPPDRPAPPVVAPLPETPPQLPAEAPPAPQRPVVLPPLPGAPPVSQPPADPDRPPLEEPRVQPPPRVDVPQVAAVPFPPPLPTAEQVPPPPQPPAAVDVRVEPPEPQPVAEAALPLPERPAATAPRMEPPPAVTPPPAPALAPGVFSEQGEIPPAEIVDRRINQRLEQLHQNQQRVADTMATTLDLMTGRLQEFAQRIEAQENYLVRSR